jgi:hypothetical protein
MKNIFRSLAIIVLAAAIGLSFAACGDGGDSGGSGTEDVTGVSLNITTLLLTTGETEKLTATVSPSNAKNKSVSWSSSASSVASVSSNGTVSAASLGTATITATTEDGGFTATCAVTVTPGTTLTSVTALQTWLASQPDNTAETAYNVKLNVNNLTNIYTALSGNPNKYVFIDLSRSTITSIPQSAFNSGEPSFTGCATLTGITIPNSVTVISYGAFYGCTNLASVNIPNNVTRLLEGAFMRCSRLTSVTIPNSVTEIQSQAFIFCENLANITIGSGVASIGDRAFMGCNSLASVTFQGTIPSSGFPVSDYFGQSIFPGDLREKFYATNASNGTPGTYTTSNPGLNPIWTRQ